jgi:hypothetical protein
VSACAGCGGAYVLVVDDLCGECAVVAFPPLPAVPGPVHEDQVDVEGNSPKYLAGWYEAWLSLHRQSAILTVARRAREEAARRPLRPVSTTW